MSLTTSTPFDQPFRQWLSVLKKPKLALIWMSGFGQK
jgi:hypothetical protein